MEEVSRIIYQLDDDFGFIGLIKSNFQVKLLSGHNDHFLNEICPVFASREIILNSFIL